MPIACIAVHGYPTHGIVQEGLIRIAPRRSSRSLGARCSVAIGAVLLEALLVPFATASAGQPTTPAPEDAALVVRWSAPPECPEQAALVERIAALVPGATGQGVAVEVDLHREPTGVRGNLQLRTPWGATTRELEAERCESVMEATALLVAIAIEPLEAERSLAREQTAPAAPPAPPEAAPSPPPRRAAIPVVTAPSAREAAEAPRPSATPPRFAQGVVRLEGGAAVGPLPEPGTTVAIAAGVRYGLLRVGAQGAIWPAQQVLHPRDRTVAATLGLWTAGVHACAGPRWRALELPVCLGLDAGAMRGQGRGALARVEVAARPFLALRLGPALAWSPVPAVALWLGIDVAAVLVRPRFTIEDLGPVHTVGVLSGRLFFAVELRLPARFAQQRSRAVPTISRRIPPPRGK